MFTDTHAHLADPKLAADLPAVLAQAAAAGVTRFFVPATGRGDWQDVLALAAPAIVPAIGIHPWFADSHCAADISQLDALLRRHPHALVGEAGLDYRRAADDAARQTQRTILSAQLDLVAQHGRAVLLHNVRAGADLLRLLQKHGIRRGAVHAFSGSLEEAQAFIRRGLKIGIGSLLLNPSAKKARRAAAELPLAALVLETDSPFMLKDAANTPANIRTIAQTVCTLRGIGLAELSAATENNATQLTESPKAV